MNDDNSDEAPTNQDGPSIRIVELRDDRVKFYLFNCDVSVANALRRVMIGEVRTMAIDLVEVQHNSSVLHDEFIAHRLGLIPLKVISSSNFSEVSGVDKFNFKRDCSCQDYCPRCSVKFELDVANDGEEETKLVYSSDLKLIDEGTKVVPAHYASEEEKNLDGEDARGIVICKLGRGQRLKLLATATKGFNKIHSKWAPVCGARFAYEADIFLNAPLFENLTVAQKLEFVESCPTKVYKFDEKLQRVYIEGSDSKKCMFCDECVELGETWRVRKDDDALVVIKPRENRYLFTLETTGALDPVEVVLSAFKILREKLSFVSERIVKDSDRSEEEIKAAVSYTDKGGFM